MKNQLLAFASALVLASCGSGETNTSEAQQDKTEKPAGLYAKKDKVSPSIELQLTANDQMKYDKKELTVYAGQEVTLTLSHSGVLEKSAMGHNFVLLNKGVDMVAFATRAMTAVDSDYIPEGNEIIVNTSLIGGGETTSITFKAPARGEYDFLCTFPGHYGMMQGKFIVE